LHAFIMCASGAARFGREESRMRPEAR
jgi:hypothetical protein